MPKRSLHYFHPELYTRRVPRKGRYSMAKNISDRRRSLRAGTEGLPNKACLPSWSGWYHLFVSVLLYTAAAAVSKTYRRDGRSLFALSLPQCSGFGLLWVLRGIELAQQGAQANIRSAPIVKQYIIDGRPSHQHHCSKGGQSKQDKILLIRGTIVNRAKHC